MLSGRHQAPSLAASSAIPEAAPAENYEDHDDDDDQSGRIHGWDYKAPLRLRTDLVRTTGRPEPLLGSVEMSPQSRAFRLTLFIG